ncbi:MAG TPA: hypothetical protein VGU20_27905 [Stellaceae bacterium]|nr:hypothetical protein [Stellaceae bacterium]
MDCGRRLSLDETAVLRDAFTESDLPYKVDFVDWHAVDDRFRRRIAAQRVALTPAAEREDAVGRLNEIRSRIGRVESASILHDLSSDRKRDNEEGQ